MKTFKFEIKEYLSRVVKIDAENYDDALDEVHQMYSDGEIVLDSSDFIYHEIEDYKD